ncbi:UNVERIFIED_CONTAM: protein NLP5 [Sesamum angustifolium]|uniref:Protein NLP5 n=1 Tax=Sesamum angustifolium TaxID=2727405 RepID=A0AAW2PUK4_9LAMI
MYPMVSELREGYGDRYSLDEFKELLIDNGADMPSVVIEFDRWIFRNNNPTIVHEKIERVVKDIETENVSLVQFWAPQVNARGSCFLTTLDQPFALQGSGLIKGLCWCRKICMHHVYDVGEGAKEDEVGPPGRAFMNRHPESSPDLRLYSTKEHPLRDLIASCGLRGYVAWPVFDLSLTQCLGVLELLIFDGGIEKDCHRMLEGALMRAELRSTYISDYEDFVYKKPAPEEIGEMLELAIDAIPQLHLAQVWMPCQQCGDTMSCMKRVVFINSADMKLGAWELCDSKMRIFLEACETLHIQSKTGKSCFFQSLCDVSKSEYPLAHYAQQARLSSRFTVCLQRSRDDVNDLFIVEFLLQPHSREDDCPCSTLHLLIHILKKLRIFKITSEEQLTELPIGLCTKNHPASLQSNRFDGTSEMIKYVQANEHESSTEFTLISRIAGYNDFISFSYLKDCLNKVVLSVHDGNRWVFGCPQRKELLHNQSIQEKVRLLIMSIIPSGFYSAFLIQFWEVKGQADKSFVTTLDQHFALATPRKGLCWYRKHCMDRQYFVDDGAKEEELGPLGRVFQVGLLNSPPTSVSTPPKSFRIEIMLFNVVCELIWLYLFSIYTRVANLESTHFRVCSLEQSSITSNNLYILQFFLGQASTKYEHLCSFLSFLLPIMKETLKSFKLASGKQLGEELVVEVISFDKNDEFTSFELHQPNVLPVRFEVTQYIEKEPRYQNSTHQLVHDTPNRHDSSKPVPETQPDDAASTDSEEGVTVTAKKTKGERNTTSFHISYDDLQLHFGKRLEDVAKELGVSRSTLKRACRDYGINRWPSRQNNKKNPSLFEASTSNKRVRSSDQQSESYQIDRGWFCADKGKVWRGYSETSAASFSGIEKLKEEVGKRFNLMNGSFKLYYLDEDEWILLAIDDDLQLCMKASTASGKTPIQILVK